MLKITPITTSDNLNHVLALQGFPEGGLNLHDASVCVDDMNLQQTNRFTLTNVKLDTVILRIGVLSRIDEKELPLDVNPRESSEYLVSLGFPSCSHHVSRPSNASNFRHKEKIRQRQRVKLTVTHDTDSILFHHDPIPLLARMTRSLHL